MVRTSGPGRYNVVGEVAEVEHVAALVAAAAQGAPVDVNGPPLPLAARLAAGALRSVYPEVPCTPLGDGIRRTVQHDASTR